MLGKTSISAIRSLLFLAQQDTSQCWSPRRLAESLEESPTYLAKVVRHMVKRGILEAERGAKGGVRLTLDPAKVSLLAVVEACQGDIVGDYCKSARPEPGVCSFHRAAVELHAAITGVLGRWTLADLLRKPCAANDLTQGIPCLMGLGVYTDATPVAARAPALIRMETSR